MFSGIIETVGQVIRAEPSPRSLVLDVQTGMQDVAEGESIAVNGVRLTAVAPDTDGLVRFFVSSETLDRTGLGRLETGGRVNLERAVTPSTRLSGHIVQGHVDAVARFAACSDVGEAKRVEFSVPQGLQRYMVEKGSIALDGISLTLNEISPGPDDDVRIALMIIPHTWEHTTLGSLTIGDAVNVEVDVIAKYVEAQCRTR